MPSFSFTCSAPSPPGEGTVSIEVKHAPVMVAPAQVWLRAVDHAGLAAFEESGSVYDGAHHEYYHEWTINGQPLDPWDAPENLPAAWNNPNEAHGREVAFLLPDAGSYVIDLVVTDRDGNTATASTGTLTVVAATTHYAASDRIYVDPDGDFSGVPGGARTATTMANLKTELEAAATAGTPIPWVLLRGGKTHAMQGYLDGSERGALRLTQQRRFSRLSSFGTGRAKVIPATSLDRAGASIFTINGTAVPDFVTFTGIDFEGGYSAATERGDPGNTLGCIGMDGTSQLIDAFVTVHDVTVTGMERLIEAGGIGVSSNNRLMIAGCIVTNWRNYGYYGGHQTVRTAIIGCRITQHVDAVHGGSKEEALVNNHGPVRITTAAHVYMAQNDLFSRSGWSPAANGNLADQPCLRLFVAAHNAGQAATVWRNVMEGGYYVANLEQAEPTYATESVHNPVVPFNVVFADNLLIGTAKSFSPGISLWRSGATIRNNIIVMPDIAQPDIFGSSVFNLWTAQSDGSPTTLDADATNATNPIVIHSNTYLNLMGEPHAGGAAWGDVSHANSYFTNLTVENNVTHKPDMTNAVTTFAPIDVATVLSGVTPRFKGERYSYDPLTIAALGAAVPDGGSFTVAYSLLTKVLQDGAAVDGGGATNQAYWTAIEATDTRHALYLYTHAKMLFIELGHFSVSFDASVVTITNTSGFTWSSGIKVVVHLDRTSLIPAMDTSYASPATIPLPRPQTGSPAIGTATTGRVTLKDAFGADRGGTPSMGALEPA